MLDQLRQIAIFAKTIDHGSFRGAARELDLSPSVVSHHISQLEEHLGVALIYRSTRKLALTTEGEQLLSSTQSLFDTVEVALSDLSNSANKPTGELRLTTASILISSQLTDMLASFSMEHPGIKLSIEYSDARQDIISGGYDIAVRMEAKHKKSANARTLFQFERRLIASTSYLMNRPKVKTPDDISDWDWIEFTPVKHIKYSFRNSKSKQIAIKPTSHIGANNAFAVYQLAKAGAGLAVVPEFFAEEGVQSGAVQYVLPAWKLDSISVFATWPSNAPKHGLISLLVDAISPSKSLR